MDFSALMKTASLHSAKASLEAAEKERARLAAAREALIAREKKEAADRKAAAERRLEREARERQRLDDERQRLLELPKTRNLYELKKEREKRGLDPSGDQDPPKAPRASSKTKASSSKRPVKDNGPLSWEEKQARKRDALFKETDDDATTGGMALARAQLRAAAGNGSRASDTTSRPQASRVSDPASARPAATLLGAKAKHLGKAAATASRPVKPSAANTARDRLKSTFNPRSFVALGSEKRDVRTIEEIERDMRLKKGGGGNGDTDRPASRTAPAASTSKLPPSSADKRKLSGDEQRARDVAKRRRLDDANRSSSKQTRRDRSDSEDSGEDSDDSDDRRRRRRKDKDKHGSGLDESSRQEIWKMFGRDRQADVRRDAFSDDSDDDMEVSPEALRREEQRATREAAREDQEEEERIRLHAEKKKQLKAK